MGKEDTFHFQDDRIRIPFRDMTTSEAEYHAETMWPYYDEKISALIEQKNKSVCLEYPDEIFINEMSHIFGVNLKEKDEREKFKKSFQFINFIIEIQQRFIRIFYKFFIPWLVAAGTGLIIIFIKEYFPDLQEYMDKIENMSK